MKGIFVFADKKYEKESKKIGSLARNLPKLTGRKNVAFEVYLISNRAMKDLNRRFLGKDRATNVLSFEAGGRIVRPDLGRNTRFLGEIFLAPDHIRAKGENPGFLVIHGFLHLLGYTHESERDRMKMEKAERKLLCQIS